MQLVRQDAFRQLQNRSLEQLAKGRPLEDVLTTLALGIEHHSVDLLCSILLLDDDGKHLHHGTAPSLPISYVKLIDGIEIGPKVGSCGTAAYRKEQVIVEDTLVDSRWSDFAKP